MKSATKFLAKYLRTKGIQLSTISNSTNIPYGKLWSSLSPKGTRELRADEFLSICKFIDKNPMEFLDCRHSA